jgi:hypothetical protein
MVIQIVMFTHCNVDKENHQVMDEGSVKDAGE